MSKHFRYVTGLSPYEYLLIQRVERAVTLLRTTNDSVSSIAYECGFGGQANFTRMFKRITGLTPSECRNMCNK